MPLIAHSSLPTFERLRQEGAAVLEPRRASHQDIRELHIGLLNMMPDAALAATERQFFRLVGESNQIAQFYIHPFTFQEIPRSDEARAYVDAHYSRFETLKKQGLDALIITGANISQPNLSAESFWEPLIEVIDWAYDNVTSTLCSCLATHAVMQFKYQQTRRRLPEKCWGVYEHRVIERRHPLVHDVNTRFDVPQSRFNEIGRDQFEAAHLKVLVESAEAGVHLAVSEDLFRLVYFQGHPEYDTISLLKEYKREIRRFISGERHEFPVFPQHYFRLQTQAILDEFRHTLCEAISDDKPLPEFPEAIIVNTLDNTWHDTAEEIINNWIGMVYQLTNTDPHLPFMQGIDPQDPLGLRGKI